MSFGYEEEIVLDLEGGKKLRALENIFRWNLCITQKYQVVDASHNNNARVCCDVLACKRCEGELKPLERNP